ncbi:MAG: hypothetical protein R3B13_33215 [Polyangiaceae bacterium]
MNLRTFEWAPWLAAALLVSRATGASEGAARCGGPGRVPCPLQAWMRTHVAAPLATGKLDEVDQALQRLESLNPAPDKWQNWSKIAREGASAAREGDAKGARAACGRCHRAYRRAYNQNHRARRVD